MNPDNTAANVALAINVVNITSITSEPMFAGRKPLSATATAYEARTGRNGRCVSGNAARRIVSQASATNMVCRVLSAIPPAIAYAGTARSSSKKSRIQSETGTPSSSRTNRSSAIAASQATIRRTRRRTWLVSSLRRWDASTRTSFRATRSGPPDTTLRRDWLRGAPSWSGSVSYQAWRVVRRAGAASPKRDRAPP